MFSLKYLYDKSDYLVEGEYYTLKDSNSTFTAYENNYMLNIAYPVSKDVLDWDASDIDNPVIAQEELFKASTGIDGVYKRIEDFEIIYGNILSLDRELVNTGSFVMNKISDEFNGSITIELTAKDNRNIYIYVYSRNLDTVSILSPNYSNTMNVLDGYILDIGKHEIGDTISIEMPLKDDVSYANVDFVAFNVDQEKFVQGYEKLKNGQLEYTNFDDTIIEGTFVAEKDEILFTTIPNDVGWNVYIDGEKVKQEDIVQIFDSLLGVKTTRGEHSIKFVYEAKFLTETLIISGLFILLLFIRFILKEKRLFIYKDKKENLWEKTSRANTIPEDLIDEEIIIEYDADE